MSNPTPTGEHEWSVDMVAVLVAKGGVDAIVAAHNAALAAERDKATIRGQRADDAERQLVAERKEQGQIRMNLGKHVEQLSDQLAAEREKFDARFFLNLEAENLQLREQLDAAVEAVMLVINGLNPSCDACESNEVVLKAVLAKIKEGK